MRSHSRQPRRLGAEDGYTLTEMLVVISIIGLIAAVLTPTLMGQLGRAKAKAAQLQLNSLAAAVELYHDDVGHFPTKDQGLMALTKEPDSVEGWTGPYLKDAKGLNDPWGRPILYSVQPDDSNFSVTSLGADGKPGGSGVNRDLTAAGP